MMEGERSVQAAPPSEVDVCIRRSSSPSCHTRQHPLDDNHSNVVLRSPDTEEASQACVSTMREMVPNAEQGDADEVVAPHTTANGDAGSTENLYSDGDVSSFGCLDASKVIVNTRSDSPDISSGDIHAMINNNNNNGDQESSPTHLISESVNNKKFLEDVFTSGVSGGASTSDQALDAGADMPANTGTAGSSSNSATDGDSSEPVTARETCSPSNHRSALTTAEGGDAPRTSEDGVTLNPFVHRIHFRFPYDYIKVAVLAVLLLPLRIMGITLSLIMAYFFSSLGLYGVPREELSKKPITGWRGTVREQVRWWVWQSCAFAGFQRTVIVGRPAACPRDAPVMVLAPHSSFSDMLPVLAVGAPSIVAKAETALLPFFGKYIDYTQPVYVWRDSTNSRQQTIQEIKHRAHSKDNWPQVMVFPEGTCTNRSCLITFKPGAFYPGVPVQPIVVRYPNRMDTTTWTWDGPGALKLLFLTLCQFHNYCEIEYLPVYRPSEEEKNNAHLFAANVRAVMAKALGVPVVDYTYDDCRLMHKAKINKLPPQTGLIEFQKLRQQLGLNLKEVEQCLVAQFSRLAQRDGKARLQDLARYLGVPDSEPELVRLFNTYDRNSRGEINFREYLLGYCEVVKPVITEQNLQASLALFNTDAEGQVTAENFSKAMASSLQLTQQEAAAIFKEIDTQNRGSFSLDEWSSACARKGELVWLVCGYQQSVAAGSRLHTRPVQAAPGKDKTE